VVTTRHRYHQTVPVRGLVKLDECRSITVYRFSAVRPGYTPPLHGTHQRISQVCLHNVMRRSCERKPAPLLVWMTC
jgi:hypothetical protein